MMMNSYKDIPVFARPCSWMRCYASAKVEGNETIENFMSRPINEPSWTLYGLLSDARNFARHRFTDERANQRYNDIKSKLPVLCVSATFNERRAENDIKAHTGLICIDIDAKDNPHITDFEKLKHKLAEFDCVAYCALSLSGQGLFVIIPIDEPLSVEIPPLDADPTERAKAIKRVKELHVGQFRALQRTFEMMGLKIDAACKDMARTRVLSYDPLPYINPDPVPYPHIMMETKKPLKTMPRPTYNHDNPCSLPDWLSRHGVPYEEHGGKYIVTCPWENLHSADTGKKQTCVWEDDEGGWCFHCFHSHCEGKGWADFRQAVAPMTAPRSRAYTTPPPPRRNRNTTNINVSLNLI